MNTHMVSRSVQSHSPQMRRDNYFLLQNLYSSSLYHRVHFKAFTWFLSQTDRPSHQCLCNLTSLLTNHRLSEVILLPKSSNGKLASLQALRRQSRQFDFITLQQAQRKLSHHRAVSSKTLLRIRSSTPKGSRNGPYLHSLLR